MSGLASIPAISSPPSTRPDHAIYGALQLAFLLRRRGTALTVHLAIPVSNLYTSCSLDHEFEGGGTLA